MSRSQMLVVLLALVVGASVLTMTGVISPWAGLALQGLTVAYTVGRMNEAGRYAREQRAQAIKACEAYVDWASSMLAAPELPEGIPEEERPTLQASRADALRTLAAFKRPPPHRRAWRKLTRRDSAPL